LTNTDPSTTGSLLAPGSSDRRAIQLLSVVTTCYRSENTIEEFARRALSAAAPLAEDVELVVVDDGSPDRSVELVRAMADKDERILLVQLSRNFGHHRAILAGLEHAAGDRIFLIDSDLEEAPENAAPMSKLLEEKGVDCVYGIQILRKGGWFERLTGKWFYRLFNLLSEVNLPPNVSTMRIMSRRYVKSLLKFRDHNPVFVPLSLIAGYRQLEFPFEKQQNSPSTYSARRRLSLTVLAITSFSGRPLYLMFAFSMIMAAVGLSYLTFVVLRALTGPVSDGWSSLMAAIMFFFSLNAAFTGLLGLYIKNILEEVKDRPRTVVQETFRKERASAGKGE